MSDDNEVQCELLAREFDEGYTVQSQGSLSALLRITFAAAQSIGLHVQQRDERCPPGLSNIEAWVWAVTTYDIQSQIEVAEDASRGDEVLH